MIRTVVALVGCVLLAACTSDASPTAGTSPSAVVATSPSAAATTSPSGAGTSAAVLSCGDYLGTDSPSAPLETLLGVVALPTSPHHPALQTSRTGGTPRLFAKTGLVVKAGHSVDLVVPAGSTFVIGWGPGAVPSRRLHVPECPNAGGDGWLAYAGGYWIDRPACVSLFVAAGGRQQQVRLGLGTPCPGQQPPGGPSER